VAGLIAVKLIKNAINKERPYYYGYDKSIVLNYCYWKYIISEKTLKEVSNE